MVIKSKKKKPLIIMRGFSFQIIIFIKKNKIMIKKLKDNIKLIIIKIKKFSFEYFQIISYFF